MVIGRPNIIFYDIYSISLLYSVLQVVEGGGVNVTFIAKMLTTLQH